MSDGLVRRMDSDGERIAADVVILTVLPEEYAAVLSCLQAPRALPGSFEHPNTYAWQVGTIESRMYGATFSVAVGKGTQTTSYGALAARHAIQLFAPHYLVFVGVAGGFARDGQQHGDVAVSSVVNAYEYGKIDTGGFSARNDFTYRCDEGLVRAADGAIARGATWWRADDNLGRTPRARIGALASGDKLIDDPDEAFFAAVQANWPKLLAVEMEGAGVAAAVHEAHADRKMVGFLLVRGISDMPHAKKRKEGSSTDERDAWKRTASCNAARFLAYLLDTSWPVPPRRRTTSVAPPIAPIPSDTSTPPNRSATEIVPPGLWRYALDRLVPRLHGWLCSVGAVRFPVEYGQITAYMRQLKAALEQDIADRTKTYVPVHARTVPRAPGAADDGGDHFVRPIQQIIRVILGRSEGGDSANAELAVINRQSRAVRNLTRTIQNASEPLVLLGDPGSGKSMTLQRVACAMIESELRRVFPVLTVYVPLGEFHVRDRVSPHDVLAYVGSVLSPEIVPLLDALELTNRLVILFDGMDEMSRDRYTEHTEALSTFAGTRRGRTRTLFTCRVTDFSPRFTHRRYVLVPFDRRQILSYLRDYFRVRALLIEGERWTLPRLAARLAARDLPLDASNPFVLWLLCHHLYATRRWPGSRIELVESFLAKAYQREQAKRRGSDRYKSDPVWPSLDLLKAALAELAFLVTERNLGRAIAISEWISHAGQREQAMTALHVGRALGLLAASKDSDHVRFDHHRLQEYFTALHLCRADVHVSWLDKLDVPRWQETIINLVLLDRGDAAMLALATALSNRLDAELAARQDYGAEIEWRRECADAASRTSEYATTTSPNNSPTSPTASTTRLQRKNAPPAWPIPLVEPRLNAREELLLGDRAELAARIVRAAPTSPAARMHLLPVLRNVVQFLIQSGNPSTQVKMMRASIHLTDSELRQVVRQPLASKIDWVRAQALLLLTEGQPGMRINLASEIGIDLTRGELIARIPAYLRAVARSRQATTAWSLGAGVVASLLRIMFFIAAAACVYWREPRRRIGEALFDGPIGPPSAIAFGVAVAAGAVAAQFWWRGKHRGIAIVGAALLLLSVEHHGSGLWRGQPEVVLPWLGSSLLLIACVGLLYPQFLLLQFIATLAAISLYCATTRKARASDTSSSLRSLLVLWRSSNDVRRALWVFVVQLLVLSIKPIDIFMKAHPLAEQVLSDTFTSLLIGVPCVVCLVLFVRWLGRPRSPMRWQRTIDGLVGFVFVLGLSIVGVYALAAVGRVVEYVVVFYSRLLFATIFLVLLVVSGRLGIRRVPWLYFLFRFRVYPPRSFTPAQWRQRIRAYSPARQAEFIVRTDHQSVGSTPAEFLDMLDQVEPSIKAEPALSTYWRYRAEIEQVLKQERQG